MPTKSNLKKIPLKLFELFSRSCGGINRRGTFFLLFSSQIERKFLKNYKINKWKETSRKNRRILFVRLRNDKCATTHIVATSNPMHRIKSKCNNEHLPDVANDGDEDASDRSAADDGTYLYWRVHNFVPPDVDVEMVWLIESSYPNRLNRLLH